MGSDDSYEPSFVHGDQSGDRSAQVIQIESSRNLSAVAVCAALCGLSAALSAWSAYTAIRAERETRMMQYYVIELDAKLIHAGFIEPKDTWTTKQQERNP